MKFTLSWLKDHLETDAPLPRITDTLTAIGLELEELIDPAEQFAAFTVGHVRECRRHPNADRLSVCLVETGTDTVQVICGAPNARTGMKGVFAPAGSTIPGTGLKLKASKIRGEASNGMLCSEREMGLSDEHEGIIELPEDAVVGTPFAAVMGLDDPVLDIGVTPNRQDCLGVRGIARDLAAAGLGRLKPLDLAPVPGAFDSPMAVRLDFDAATANACPCFVGRYFRGLRNGPSPAWMQARLKAIGLRPISALVDITNYVTYDLGRPLHVFDADKVNGDIHVRLARPDETLLALNGKEYALDPEVTVIADETLPEGLGGVIGGEASGCTEATVNMFLEVALFDPLRTAATGRRLGIESDARYRFERGVDPGMVLPGAEIATRLILELCGGEASELVIAGTPDAVPIEVVFRPAQIAALAGIEIAESEQRRILDGLGFAVDAADPARWRITAPLWRSDIGGEADIVEEIARIHGFDAIPAVPLPDLSVIARPALDARQRRVPMAKRTLAARGLVECVTWSFTAATWAELFGRAPGELVLENPISSELDVMRPSVLPNLVAAVARNIDRGSADLALFEVGPQYDDDSPSGQQPVAAGLRRGLSGARHWRQRPRPVDAFDAKADAIAVLEAVGAPLANLQTAAEAPAWYHPGRAGALRLGPRATLAWFGELHPAVCDAMDVAGPIAAFEVFLNAVPPPKAQASRNRARLDVSDLPAVERDFAFVVADGTAAEAIVRAARGAEKSLISRVDVFDVYAGEGIDAGRKSIAISVRLEPRDATLTDDQIEAVSRRIVAAVGKATGATLRG